MVSVPNRRGREMKMILRGASTDQEESFRVPKHRRRLARDERSSRHVGIIVVAIYTGIPVANQAFLCKRLEIPNSRRIQMYRQCGQQVPTPIGIGITVQIQGWDVPTAGEASGKSGRPRGAMFEG